MFLSSVVTPKYQECFGAQTIHVVTSQPSYLSSLTSNATNCGKATTPWILEAATGQKVKVTLQVFHASDVIASPRSDGCSVRVGSVLDLRTQMTHVLCASGSTSAAGARADEQVIVSNGNRLQVEFEAEAARSSHFLLRFEALGCADIAKPPHTWLRRTGDQLVVGCDVIKQQWHLRCEKDRWVGVIGNCSQRSSNYTGYRYQFIHVNIYWCVHFRCD